MTFSLDNGTGTSLWGSNNVQGHPFGGELFSLETFQCSVSVVCHLRFAGEFSQGFYVCRTSFRLMEGTKMAAK